MAEGKIEICQDDCMKNCHPVKFTYFLPSLFKHLAADHLVSEMNGCYHQHS